MASLQPNLVSLKEFAKEHKFVVPDHYIQQPQETTFVTLPNLPSIPTIDMNDLIKMQESDDIEQQRKNLLSVCHEWGIFQLVNHGVDKLLVEKMKEEIVGFFNMPLEEKMKYKVKAGETFEGFGQTILPSQDHKVDWVDRLYMITNPLHLRQPHLLPQLPPTLRDTMENYLGEVQKLVMTLFSLVGEALGIDTKEMVDVFEDGLQTARMAYYPPCPEPNRVVGLGPHTDASALSILLQVDDIEGLQVNKDGVWIPVKFLPDAVVVIVGDVLEIMSNGVYKSIEHKASINATNERISFATFFNPNLEADIGPAKSLLMKTGNQPMYRTIRMKQFFNDFFSGKLNGKTFLEQMKIDNEACET